MLHRRTTNFDHIFVVTGLKTNEIYEIMRVHYDDEYMSQIKLTNKQKDADGGGRLLVMTVVDGHCL